MPRAVVFAYHDVGVRCLRVLLAHGVDVPLVVTHTDSPGETIWFGSVAATAEDYGIPLIAPDDPNTADLVARITALAPDFLFSFYYRKMLKAPLLAAARRGALNMHGSLLPRYRGRAPVNWAVLHGERETGATLHYMTAKPDHGDIVAQTAVPILPDDTAREVFDKVTVAAEMTLDRVLPAAHRRHGAPRGAGSGGRQLFRRPPARGWRDRLEPRCGRRAQSGPSRRAALSRRVHRGRRRGGAGAANPGRRHRDTADAHADAGGPRRAPARPVRRRRDARGARAGDRRECGRRDEVRRTLRVGAGVPRRCGRAVDATPAPIGARHV